MTTHWDYMAIEAYEEHLRRTAPHRVNWFLGLHPDDQMLLCGGWHVNAQDRQDDAEYRREMELGGKVIRGL